MKDLGPVIDGGKASMIVRDYFREIHGPGGPILFQIEDVEKQLGVGWMVECSFFISMNAIAREYYVIAISDQGEILAVKKADLDETDDEEDEEE